MTNFAVEYSLDGRNNWSRVGVFIWTNYHMTGMVKTVYFEPVSARGIRIVPL